MGNLTLTSVSWETLDVDCFCSILGHFNSKIRSELGHGVRSLLYRNFLRIEGLDQILESTRNVSLVTLARVEVRLLLVTVERLGWVRLGIGLIRLLILLPIADRRRQLVMLGVLNLHRWLTLETQGITTDGGRSKLGRGVGIDAIEKIFNLSNLALDGRVVAVLQLAKKTLDLLDVQVS